MTMSAVWCGADGAAGVEECAEVGMEAGFEVPVAAVGKLGAAVCAATTVHSPDHSATHIAVHSSGCLIQRELLYIQ